MKTLIIYLAKKYILASINEVLESRKDDVQHITQVIRTWIERLEKIITQLKTINSRVEDGNITEEEITSTMKEVETLMKGF